MTLGLAREFLARAQNQGADYRLRDDPERIADALVGIGNALVVLASPNDAVTAMRAHAAETDHALTLRLIDLDVFGVSCAGEHCNFRLEWRAT